MPKRTSENLQIFLKKYHLPSKHFFINQLGLFSKAANCFEQKIIPTHFLPIPIAPLENKLTGLLLSRKLLESHAKKSYSFFPSKKLQIFTKKIWKSLFVSLFVSLLVSFFLSFFAKNKNV